MSLLSGGMSVLTVKPMQPHHQRSKNRTQKKLNRFSKKLKHIAHTSQGWKRMASNQREAMDMILHKIGRILNGNANYADSWIDIEGYSKLISDWLKGESK